MDLVHNVNKEKECRLKRRETSKARSTVISAFGGGRPFAPPPPAMGRSPEKEK